MQSRQPWLPGGPLSQEVGQLPERLVATLAKEPDHFVGRLALPGPDPPKTAGATRQARWLFRA